MLVDASAAPAAAIWQGVMLGALFIPVAGVAIKEGKWFPWAMGLYVALGIALFIALV